MLPCPTRQSTQKCAPSGAAECRGVDYSSEVVRDVLLSSIFDQDIKREVLGDSALESKTLTSSSDSWRTRKRGTLPAEAARLQRLQLTRKYQASSPQAKVSPAAATLLSGQKRRRLRCRCGAVLQLRLNMSVNTTAYKNCRDCRLKQGKEPRAKRGSQKTAVAAAGRHGFELLSPDDCPPAARISSASIALTNRDWTSKSPLKSPSTLIFLWTKTVSLRHSLRHLL